jgi:hypothetical protein
MEEQTQQTKEEEQQESTISATSNSDDDSERPEKRQRVEHYCYCHAQQETIHASHAQRNKFEITTWRWCPMRRDRV